MRGLLLGFIEHLAPELLTAVARDGSVFKASESFMRRFLYQELRWVPRIVTRAAQKVPVDAEDQCYRSFLRQAYTTQRYGIRHASLRINFDQTQVVIQDNNTHTFAEEGSKQVSGTGKEEKRAWTAVAGVSAAGVALPFQIVMKGATAQSLPSPKAPFTAEADTVGIDFCLNVKNYWSNLPLLERYLEKIIVPYWIEQKLQLGYDPDQVCILQLDVWSVHRSIAFRDLVRRRWPWIKLDYVPGGCTGIWQPCDVGIQRPLKHAIRRLQLEDVIEETVALLDHGTDPSQIRVDITIKTLRNRSPRWFVEAFHAINKPDLILQVRVQNLSRQFYW
jgi:hypothetical protein